jgi:ABC-2 type transport system permease protein
MRNFFTIWRRELTAYFVSPAAYVTMVLVLGVTGIGFWLGAKISAGAPVKMDVLLFWLPTLWLMVMIVASVTTMRLFAEEKRSGTIETLMTAPVTEAEVVLGKYAAALTLFIVIFAPTAAYTPILRKFSSGMEVVDPRQIMTGYLIVFLIGAFYVSVGVLMSALMRSQVAAAIGSFAVLCVLFALVSVLGPVFEGDLSEVFNSVSAIKHVKEFSRGVIDLRAIVLYVSGTALMLFMSVKALESRRWM